MRNWFAGLFFLAYLLVGTFGNNTHASPDLLSPSGMTQVMDGQNFDDSIMKISLGHSFTYYGGTFNDAWMSTNGFLMFYDSSSGIGNSRLGNASINNFNRSLCCDGLNLKALESAGGNITPYSYMIAPLWTDIIDKTSGANSGFFYETSNSGSSFLWYNVNEYYNNNKNTFQVNIHTDNSFDFVYDEVDITNHDVFIGFTGDLTANEDNESELNQLQFADSNFTEFNIDFHSETVPGGRAWYGTDGGYSSVASVDCSNALNDSTCPGYAAAVFAQQCNDDQTSNSECEFYDEAVYENECNNDPQSDQFCPGYMMDDFEDYWEDDNFAFGPDDGQDDGQPNFNNDPFDGSNNGGQDDGQSFEDSFGVSEEEFYGFSNETGDMPREDADGSLFTFGSVPDGHQEDFQGGFDIPEEGTFYPAPPISEEFIPGEEFQEAGAFELVMIERPEDLPGLAPHEHQERPENFPMPREEPFFEEQFEDIQDFERSFEEPQEELFEEIEDIADLEEDRPDESRAERDIREEEAEEEVLEEPGSLEELSKPSSPSKKGGNKLALSLSLSTTSKLISSIETNSSNSAGKNNNGNGNVSNNSQSNGNVSNNSQNNGNVQDMNQNSGQSNQNQQQNSDGSAGSQNNGSNQYADGSDNGSQQFNTGNNGGQIGVELNSSAIFGSDTQLFTQMSGESGGDDGTGSSNTQFAMNIEQIGQNVALGDSAPIGFSIIEPVTDMIMQEIEPVKSLAEKMADANKKAREEKSNIAAQGQTVALQSIAVGTDLSAYYNNTMTASDQVYLQDQVYLGGQLKDNNRTMYDLSKENHGTLQQLIRSQY